MHTYEAMNVTHNSAKAKGYVCVQGTDDVEEQGFEYWATDEGESQRVVVKATLKAAEANNVSVVFATGQVMTATLENLQPSTTYCCRAFVKTTSGTTYGEEQTFTTQAGDASGVFYVATEKAAPTITGYFDLQGRCLRSPTKGINIVRYSDGTSRKVFVR